MQINLATELSAAGTPLSQAWFPLKPHPKQRAAYLSNKRFVQLPCGRGSGKTEIARRRIVRELPVSRPYSDVLLFYALPTYGQAKRVAWLPLLRLIPRSWIKRVRESSLTIETVFGSILYLVGLDQPQRLEGNQYTFGIIDESSDIKPGVFDRSIAPALTHHNAPCWRIGVPKRFGVGAAEYRRVCELGASGKDPETITYSWPSSDLLSPEQIETFKRILDPRDFREQFEASWEDIGGSIFYAFSEENIRENKYRSDQRIFVGSDFNVDPMCWVLCHIQNDTLYVFDELYVKNTNTRECLDLLYKRYPEHKSGWTFIGDATARSRKTSAAVSDYIQISNDRRFPQKQLAYLRKNPPLADRFAACNAILKNADGQIRCFIDPSCKRLIEDLKLRSYKEGGRDPDDYGDLGHMSDAWGYVVYRVFPLTVEIDMAESIIIRK